MPTSKLTSKGRITIPKRVRDLLGLKAGDQVNFRFDKKGRLIVESSEPGPPGKLVGIPVEESAAVRFAWELVRSGAAHWQGGKPKGSARPPEIKGKSAAEVVLEDRR